MAGAPKLRGDHVMLWGRPRDGLTPTLRKLAASEMGMAVHDAFVPMDESVPSARPCRVVRSVPAGSGK